MARTLSMAAILSAVLLASAMFAAAQTADQDHQAHHPDEATKSESLPAPAGPAEQQSAPHPETDQERSQGMMREGMMGHGMMGQGMMGQGMPMMAPGMMRQGMMGRDMMAMCPMMRMGMTGLGSGPGLLYGLPQREQPETTVESARAWLQQQLERHGNPRLMLGEIAAQPDGTVIAEIVTVDGSLVQRLAFNRYPGFVRQVQ